MIAHLGFFAKKWIRATINESMCRIRLNCKFSIEERIREPCFSLNINDVGLLNNKTGIALNACFGLRLITVYVSLKANCLMCSM